MQIIIGMSRIFDVFGCRSVAKSSFEATLVKQAVDLEKNALVSITWKRLLQQDLLYCVQPAGAVHRRVQSSRHGHDNKRLTHYLLLVV